MNKKQPIEVKKSRSVGATTEKSFNQKNFASLNKQLSSFDYDNDAVDEEVFEDEEEYVYPSKESDRKDTALYSSLVILNEIANDLNQTIKGLDIKVTELSYQIGVGEGREESPSPSLEKKESINLNDIARKFAYISEHAKEVKKSLSKIV